MRAFRTNMALAAAAVTFTANSPVVMAEELQMEGFVLDLHRLPDHGIRTETYRRRRLESDVDGSMEVVPLNLGLGTHYAWVYAGTPPQRASVITDTGSSIMAFPCSGCNGCGVHTDQPFNADLSSTLTHVTCADHSHFRCSGCLSQTNTCNISQAYMEGSSWHASVVEDIVYLGGENSTTDTEMKNHFGTHFQFGCQTSETGEDNDTSLLLQVADGIMGLSNSDDHIIAKLYKEKKIPSKVFALCFGFEGGAMAIGQPDTKRHKGEIAYAKLIPEITPLHSQFYNVKVLDIRVGNVSIEAEPAIYTQGNFIVDSGTTDSYLPKSLRTPFMKAFQTVTGLPYQTAWTDCHGYTEADLDTLPNIQIVLETPEDDEMILEVTPSQYLVRQNDNYCAAIFLSEAQGGVIGANIMTDRDVIFDRDNNRVGFVDADCTSSSVSNFTTGDDVGVTVDAPVEETTLLSETSTPTPAPTPAPTPSPTSTSTPTYTATPIPSPTSKQTLVPTLSPVPKSSLTFAPNYVGTPSETPDADVTATEPEIPSTPSTTSTAAPVPSSTTATTDGTANTGTDETTDNSATKPDDHPMVLTIVGTVLAVAFILVIAGLFRHKKSNRDVNWSRVKEDEDDDDEAELGLVDPRHRSKKKTSGPAKHQRLSDQADSDDDDDDDDRDFDRDDDDDDDEDEIFDRGSHHDHDETTKHDTRMLERL